MNAVFAAIFILSAAVLLVVDPSGFLPALLDGATRSATLSLSLLATYAAWLGLMKLWEESGVARGISKLLKPLCRKLFKTEDEEALSAIGMNLSANLLGIGGAATPYGIRAATLLDKSKNARYSSSMLFVINATSLQLIPTSVVAFRIAAGSASAADIILPTMARHGVFLRARGTSRQAVHPCGEAKGKEKKPRGNAAQKSKNTGGRAETMKFFSLIIPLIFLATFLFAVFKKVRVYDSFTEGVKGAIPLVMSVFPYIAAVMMLTKLFEVSGLEAKLVQLLAPLLRGLGIPEEIARLVLIKPLSGNGSTAVLSDILARYGADSYAARCACVAYGSSETVFYIGAVYFSEVKQKKFTAALVISLFSYFASVVLCCFLCKIM